MPWLRRILLHCARLSGAFAIAQRLTRARLRILCYHGFSVTDEHVLTPYVFMRPQTFERRLRILRKRRMPVISLEEAITRLRAGTIASAETVITLDDGWASNLAVMPLLRTYAYPSCIYITTEHLSAGTEAFNVMVIHLVHASRKASVTLRDIHPRIDGEYPIAQDPAAAATALIAAALRIPSLQERQRLLAPLAAALGIDYAEFTGGGRFRFLSADEIRTIAKLGASIQLHTHTHNLPDDDFDAMAHEIRENQSAIEGLTGIRPIHFCYPSGKYSARHADWLSRLGIASATTCDVGLNDSSVPTLFLRRYLDSESTSDIEFEAEITGFRELLRNLRSGLKSLLR
jgi:peptidoglycan/xylan/chitin deacetylase (PgdA/CDA1 family)